MATFRTQHHVPDVYVKGSRDFQLFCNLFDCINSGIKFDIDSIPYILDTNQCNERLIPYLQTKLGFWTKEKISAEKLRIILKGFPYAVKNKGSIIGIEQAVQIFLKVINIKTSVHIEIINIPQNSTESAYTVVIGTEKYLGDTTILDEILKYIIPAGYGIRYVFYADTTFESGIEHADSVKVVTGEPSLLSAVNTTYTDVNGNKLEYATDIINNVAQTTVTNAETRNPDVTTEDELKNLYNLDIVEDDSNGN